MTDRDYLGTIPTGDLVAELGRRFPLMLLLAERLCEEREAETSSVCFWTGPKDARAHLAVRYLHDHFRGLVGEEETNDD